MPESAALKGARFALAMDVVADAYAGERRARATRVEAESEAYRLGACDSDVHRAMQRGEARPLEDDDQALREAAHLLRRVEALVTSEAEARANPKLAELATEATSWLAAHGPVGDSDV